MRPNPPAAARCKAVSPPLYAALGSASCVQQELDYFQPVCHGGVMQRSGLVGMGRVDIGSDADEIFSNFQFACPGRVVERRSTQGIARVDRDSGSDQFLHPFQIAGAGGVVELFDAFAGGKRERWRGPGR